jgi:diguanylate cyclase (GGDEF)-like protein/PAS domain S-box-containing protein
MSVRSPDNSHSRPSGELGRTDVLRDLVWNLPEPIYVMNEDGEFVDANPAFLQLVGVPDKHALLALAHDSLWEDPVQRRELLRRVATQGQLRNLETGLRRADGETRTVLDTCYSVRNEETGEKLLYGIMIDISERKKVERELRRLAVRDPLTGCYNRRYLDDIERGLSDGDEVWGAVVVDIDNFKRYNDEYGHKEGDEVLLKVARFLSHRVRPGDAVVRIGGDEFLVLLFGDDTEHIEDVARRFEQAAPKAAPVPFSIGWDVRKGKETLRETIDRADRQLIHVRGKERASVYQRRSGAAGEPGAG